MLARYIYDVNRISDFTLLHDGDGISPFFPCSHVSPARCYCSHEYSKKSRTTETNKRGITALALCRKPVTGDSRAIFNRLEYFEALFSMLVSNREN